METLGSIWCIECVCECVGGWVWVFVSVCVWRGGGVCTADAIKKFKRLPPYRDSIVA